MNVLKLSKYKIATFCHHERRGTLYTAYTRIYNPEWEGYIIYEIEARNGTEAKKIAKCKRKLEESHAEANKNVLMRGSKKLGELESRKACSKKVEN